MIAFRNSLICLSLLIGTLVSVEVYAVDPILEGEWLDIINDPTKLSAVKDGVGHPILVARLREILSNPQRLREELGWVPTNPNQSHLPISFKRFLIWNGVRSALANETDANQRIQFVLAIVAAFRDHREQGESLLEFLCNQFMYRLFLNLSPAQKTTVVNSLVQYARDDRVGVEAYPALALVGSGDIVVGLVNKLSAASSSGTDERMLRALVFRRDREILSDTRVQRYMLSRLQSKLPRVAAAALRALVDTRNSATSEVNRLDPATVHAMLQSLKARDTTDDFKVRLLTALSHDMRSNWFMQTSDLDFNSAYEIIIPLMQPDSSDAVRLAAAKFFEARKPSDPNAQIALLNSAFSDQVVAVANLAFMALGTNTGARSSERRLSDPLVQMILLERMSAINGLNPGNLQRLYLGATLISQLPRGLTASFYINLLMLWSRTDDALKMANGRLSADSIIKLQSIKSKLEGVLRHMPRSLTGTIALQDLQTLTDLRKKMLRTQSEDLTAMVYWIVSRLPAETIDDQVGADPNYDAFLILTIFNLPETKLKAWLTSEDQTRVDQVLEAGLLNPETQNRVLDKLRMLHTNWRPSHPRTLTILFDLMTDNSLPPEVNDQAATILANTFSSKTKIGSLPISDQKLALRLKQLIAQEPVNANQQRAKEIAMAMVQALKKRLDFHGSICESSISAS